jgi:DNA-binding transcriptional MerR regulator
MPYKITAIRAQKEYIKIVNRSALAYGILRNLAALGLSLSEIKDLLILSNYPSQIRLLSEEVYYKLTEHQPQLDLIYDVMTLKTNVRLYFHTNWRLPPIYWKQLSQKLNQLQIFVITL